MQGQRCPGGVPVLNTKTEAGSLLVDWSTALSLAATTAMVAVPGLQTFVHESQRSAVVNQLQLEIRKANDAANAMAQTVTLCASVADGSRCATDSNWSGGWLAFVDVDGDGAMSAGETRLTLWRARSPHPGIGVVAEPATISFRPYYSRPFRGSTEAQVTVWDRAGHGGARTVEVDRAGVPRLSEVRWPTEETHARR